MRLKASRAARLLIPPLPVLTSLEAKVLAATWTLAALSTLGVALAQSVRMFLLSALAVLFGTLAALWMLDGLARR
uniref:Uncharacterized protein n=1 Tax=Caulobacter sp. (strain K31) TaxID=366602 RepID=B0SWX2_CAUSK